VELWCERDRQTDGRTEGRTALLRNTASYREGRCSVEIHNSKSFDIVRASRFHLVGWSYHRGPSGQGPVCIWQIHDNNVYQTATVYNLCFGPGRARHMAKTLTTFRLCFIPSIY